MRLRADHIRKDFTKEGVRDVSFTADGGTFTVITGESGVGKTTLLHILTGMLHPDDGQVFLDEKEIYTAYSRKERVALLGNAIGYMMQGVSLIPTLSVYENLTFPLRLTGRAYEEEKLDHILEKLGIQGIRHSYPGRISGGEYRRVLLSGVLLAEPKILICDEPTSNLDSKSAEIVREILYDYKDQDHSVIVATHDTAFTEADRRVAL